MRVDKRFLKKSYTNAIGLFVLDLVLLIATTYGALTLENIFLRFGCSLLSGWLIALMFVLGHDACHGSLTDSKRLNRILGTLAFLPSTHPFSLWALGHHRHHHAFTNLAGEQYDYVWNPYSKEEFDQLPKHRQWLERFYRHWSGHGFYYMYEIWWKKMFFPRPSETDGYRLSYVLDSLLIGGFLACQVVGIVWLAESGYIEQPWWSALFFGLIFPNFIWWNWLMGFCVLLHHNHPDIRWYKDPEEWRRECNHVTNTCHIIFPGPLNKVFHNMMEHNAHHMSSGIPCYNLLKAQNHIEENDNVSVTHWDFPTHLRITRHCQLYDYENHRWLNFNGEPSTDWPTEQQVPASA